MQFTVHYIADKFLYFSHRAGGDPLAGVDVHVADLVAGDGGATVVLWRHPAQLDVLGPDLVGLQHARRRRHVEDVDATGGLESAGLACQLDGVEAGVALAVCLGDAQHRVLIKRKNEKVNTSYKSVDNWVCTFSV